MVTCDQQEKVVSTPKIFVENYLKIKKIKKYLKIKKKLFGRYAELNRL